MQSIKISFGIFVFLVILGLGSTTALAATQTWFFHDASSTPLILGGWGAVLSTTTPHVAASGLATSIPDLFTQSVAVGDCTRVFRFRPGVAATLGVPSTSWSYAAANSNNDGGVDNNPGCGSSGSLAHISTTTTTRLSARGWWSDVPLNGTFNDGTWHFRPRTFDARAALGSHLRLVLWRIPQNNATTGARYLTEMECGNNIINANACDTWVGGTGTLTTGSGTASSTPGAITMNNEYIFAEVFDHTTTTGGGERGISLQYEGSTLAQNDRLRIITPNFKPGMVQSAYRWFNNTNTADVGTALAAQDTAATAPAQGTAFRLRMLLHATSSDATAGDQFWTLQSAVRSGTCDTGFVGETYATVTPSTGDIRFADNAAVAATTTLTANAADPTHSLHNIFNESYREDNPFTNSVATTTSGGDAKFDFPLVDFSAPAGTTYCFRAVKFDGGGNLAGYNVIPEITTVAAANVDLEQFHYRFRQDIVSEDTNTWLAAEDATSTTDRGGQTRVRIEISNKGTAAAAQTRFKLEYGITRTGANGASGCVPVIEWRPVGESGSTTPDWNMMPSQFLTNDASTTDFTGSLTNENTTFLAGVMKDIDNQTTGMNLSTTNFTEHEVSLTLASSSVGTDTTYCFRLISATNLPLTPVFTYVRYPATRVTIPGVAGGGGASAAAEGTPAGAAVSGPQQQQGAGAGSSGGGDSTPPATQQTGPAPQQGGGSGSGESGYIPKSSSLLATLLSVGASLLFFWKRW